MENDVSADVEVAGSLTKEIHKRVQATGRFEPSLRLHKIPRCPSCLSANPQGLSHCPKCGEPAPPITERRYETSIAVNLDPFMPWHARALFAVGAWLRRLALWLRGE